MLPESIGCTYANELRELNEGLEHRCTLCRNPTSKAKEEVQKNIMERVKANDPAAYDIWAISILIKESMVLHMNIGPRRLFWEISKRIIYCPIYTERGRVWRRTRKGKFIILWKLLPSVVMLQLGTISVVTRYKMVRPKER